MVELIVNRSSWTGCRVSAGKSIVAEHVDWQGSELRRMIEQMMRVWVFKAYLESES